MFEMLCDVTFFKYLKWGGLIVTLLFCVEATIPHEYGGEKNKTKMCPSN